MPALPHWRKGEERRDDHDMNRHLPETTEPKRTAAAISDWENEGGAPGCNLMHHQYGRHVESDRFRTNYQVFPDTPACFDGKTMTRLSRSEATKGMRHLNLRNADQRKEFIELPFAATKPVDTGS
jgi:hypothetical protein